MSSAAKWERKQRSQSGDVKRCTIVMEHRSSSFGEIDGSWVEMKARVPRWRWSRIDDKRVLVKVEASDPAFMYCQMLERLHARGSCPNKRHSLYALHQER